MKITSAFDSGNVRCLATDEPTDIGLEINPASPSHCRKAVGCPLLLFPQGARKT